MDLEQGKDSNNNTNNISNTVGTGVDTEEAITEPGVKKKARKERKKARKDKRTREQDMMTEVSPIQSPPGGLRRTMLRFPAARPSLIRFDKYDHKYKWEHATSSVVLKQGEKYNELTMKVRLLWDPPSASDPTTT